MQKVNLVDFISRLKFDNKVEIVCDKKILYKGYMLNLVSDTGFMPYEKYSIGIQDVDLNGDIIHIEVEES